MKWKLPNKGEERLVRKFAWWPFTIGTTKIWFENYWELQRWNDYYEQWVYVQSFEAKEDYDLWKEEQEYKEKRLEDIKKRLKNGPTHSFFGVTGSIQAPPVSTWQNSSQMWGASTRPYYGSDIKSY